MQGILAAYLDYQVRTAPPHDLVEMLYTGAVAQIRAARRLLGDGLIFERSSAVDKACRILLELESNLDERASPEWSARYRAVYARIRYQLLKANLNMSDALLAEAQEAAEALRSNWLEVKAMLGQNDGMTEAAGTGSSR